MLGLPRRLARSERGAIALTAALMVSSVLGFAAMAVDFGSVFLETRQLQGDADLAALAAANDLGDAQAAATATANANGWRHPVTAQVVYGAYIASSAITAAQRFTPGVASPNAVQVTLTTQADLFFGASLLGVSSLPITRTATAATAQLASFSIGSGLASLNGGVANQVLDQLTGSQVQLSVADYNALATANVDLLQYAQGLQTDMHLQGASFSQVLSAQISQSEAMKVMSTVLTSEGQSAAGTAAQEIATATSTTTSAGLNQVLDLGPYANQDHDEAASGASVGVNALNLTTAMLQVAQGGREVSLNLGTDIPGVDSATLWLAIGQRPTNSPWLTVNGDGSVTISTAQARLYLNSQLAPGALSTLGVTALETPIYVEIASAQAKLSSISCPSLTGAGTEALTLQVNPSVGEIALGSVNTSQLDNFTAEPTLSAATLLQTPLLSATAQATANLGGADWQTVSFDQADIQSDAVKTVSTTDIAQATVASLFSGLQVNVQVLRLGLGVGSSAVASTAGSLLSAAAPSLDATIDTATDLLGVRLGEAMVQVNGVRCDDAALVS